MRVHSLAWPGAVGLFGGLVAAEAELAYELAVAPDFGCTVCKSMSGVHPAGAPELVVWLILGIFGPSLWLALERPRLLARSLVSQQMRAGWRRVVATGVCVGLAAAVLTVFSDPILEKVALPWLWVPPQIAVGLTACIALTLVLLPILGLERFRKWFAARFAVSFLAALATFGAFVVALGMHFGPV